MPKGIDVGKDRTSSMSTGAGSFKGSGMKTAMPMKNLDQRTGGVTQGTDQGFARTVNGYNDKGNGGPS